MQIGGSSAGSRQIGGSSAGSLQIGGSSAGSLQIGDNSTGSLQIGGSSAGSLQIGGSTAGSQIGNIGSFIFKKKGFVVGNSDPVGGAKVNTLNTGWYYTWGPTPSMLPIPNNVKFTPMIWSLPSSPYPQNVYTAISNIQNLQIISTDNCLLTYNEPDGLNRGAQANMTVGDAVNGWPTILSTMVSSYTTPPRIGSPVMYGSTLVASTDAPGQGKNINCMPQPQKNGTRTVNISNTSLPNNVTLNPSIWLDNFLLQIYDINKTTPYSRSPFPDFICIHWYGPPQVNSFKTYITNVYTKYNLKIWVTEYSCADWNATCCPTAHPTDSSVDWSYPNNVNTNIANSSQITNTTAQFMLQTMQWMNSSPYVERYTWKERPLLIPPNSDITYSGSKPISVAMNGSSYPLDDSMSIMSSSNPDFMGQSTLFKSYEHFPSNLPPLTTLGQLYASI